MSFNNQIKFLKKLNKLKMIYLLIYKYFKNSSVFSNV